MGNFMTTRSQHCRKMVLTGCILVVLLVSCLDYCWWIAAIQRPNVSQLTWVLVKCDTYFTIRWCIMPGILTVYNILTRRNPPPLRVFIYIRGLQSKLHFVPAVGHWASRRLNQLCQWFQTLNLSFTILLFFFYTACSPACWNNIKTTQWILSWVTTGHGDHKTLSPSYESTSKYLDCPTTWHDQRLVICHQNLQMTCDLDQNIFSIPLGAWTVSQMLVNCTYKRSTTYVFDKLHALSSGPPYLYRSGSPSRNEWS